MEKTALIVGGAKGLGRGISKKFAETGIQVAIGYRSSQSEAESIVEQIRAAGGKAAAFQADITDSNQAKYLADRTYSEYGGLDILINTTGDFLWKKTSEVSDKEYRQMMSGNADTLFYITRACLPYMRKNHWGRIIHFGMTRITRLPGASMMAGYTAGKAAGVVLMRAFAKEEISNGITVNMVCPGIIENKEINRKEAKQLNSQDIPARRPGSWEDIADAIQFFMSDSAEFITGQVLEVAGGWGL